MKCYELSTVFNFGKHKGKTLQQVFTIAPSYADWCLKEVSYFVISHKTFNLLKELNPKYFFSSEARNAIVSNETGKQIRTNCNTEYNYGDLEFDRWRIAQHPELRYRSEHEAIELLDLSDEIGCEPEDLIANLDM